MIVTLILFLLILGVVVLVHEFGHFLFAKLMGVHVYEFSIGMGPNLLQKASKSGTKYSIRAIPLGGYVSLAGEEVEIDPEVQKGRNLQDKKVWQRFLIMFMGVGFNFIFAFLVLFFVGLIFGAQDLSPRVSEVTEGYPAALAGLEANDKILRINDHKVSYIDDISLYLTIEDLSEPITFEVEKTSGEVKQIEVQALKEEVDGSTRYSLGITLVPKVERGFIESIVYAFNKEMALFKQMFVVLGNLFTGNLALSNLSGPVGIYSIVGQMQAQGAQALLYLVALLSINVGIMNILPFPAFDGGRILFLFIEKIKGSPVNPKVENIIHAIGFILIIALMIYVTFNDILRLF